MVKKRRKFDTKKVKRVVPYVVTAILTLVLVFVGSLDKHNSGMNLSLDAFAENNYKISVDQLSELYVVADLSDALGLASAGDVASNYVVTTSMYDAGQTSSGKLEKPNITNLNISRGVVEYVVTEGDTMDSIAAKYGISTDDIRWSNDRKTTDVSVGDVLYIPSSGGIVYTVKSGDTIESIVSNYGSNAAEIIALNDLEVSGISEGMRILIKGGSLPETERPEYEPPAPVVTTYYYTYLGSTSDRQNIEVVYGAFYEAGGGQCVNWALYMRPDLQQYQYALGNANNWAYAATNLGLSVNNTPSAGAIFQTTSGWYGHVGYVESVNPDGSIVVTEMNYGYIPYRVIRATIPANVVGNFNYIH
ncbi:LysM peptidoglycan-binding domain-containing protein [Candidatus Saccharibacteria bacterium]|nr:LysM peptidoglycan-binding domain-containing protein [Candidatus Saccharibacteria bacterium]